VIYASRVFLGESNYKYDKFDMYTFIRLYASHTAFFYTQGSKACSYLKTEKPSNRCGGFLFRTANSPASTATRSERRSRSRGSRGRSAMTGKRGLRKRKSSLE
jgi:hypothetical protein